MCKSFRVYLAAVLLVAALLLTGCSDATSRNDQASEGSSPPSSNGSPSQREEFVFTRENFPRMDGSTSTVPLAEAAACVLLGVPRESVSELAQFSRTTQSFRNLAAGLCDILIVSEPTPEVFEELRELGFEIDIAPIALDALVFVVNARNPVMSLTHEQLQGIYMERITNWSEVGGDDMTIVPFQRNPEAGSQVLMEKLVMDGLDMANAPIQNFGTAFGMGELISALRGFDGSANAIGYTVFYYAQEMRMADGLKILQVGGATPEAGTIRSGEYPFVNPYYVVIGAHEPEDSPARIMFNWLLSDEGQELVRLEGYVSMR